ncbi:MAG: 3D domain-containing protein [bacterium]
MRFFIIAVLLLSGCSSEDPDAPLDIQMYRTDAGGDAGSSGTDASSMRDTGDGTTTWPEYSGDPCDVDGKVGRCLPTDSCDGVATPGHCPGPAGMQCCVTACTADSQSGLCGDSTTCGDSVASACAGPSNVACCLGTDNRTRLGTVWNTYYYLSVESDYSGAADTTLFDSNCDAIAQVPAAYSDAACIEGSGRLKDGTVVNYASTCTCGRPCPTGGTVCWKALDPATKPWGEGAFSNALVPLHSIAVDKNTIPLKTVLYLPDFDGVQIPAIGGVDAFTHDGCFRADDVGGAIRDLHIDIFAGPAGMWRHLEGVFPTRTNFDAFVDVPKCAYLEL